MEKANYDLSEMIYKKFEEVFNSANPDLIFNNNEVKIFAPKYAIEYLSAYFNKGVKNPDISIITFRGYDIVLHPYNEIVLANLEYPLFQTDSMINKVSL
jgi:hypothetical protein